MRITNINIPKGTLEGRVLEDGLSDIKMDKLDDLVILAGKNGSGKTRILNRIETVLRFKLSRSFLDSVVSDLQNYQNAINIHRRNIVLIEQRLEATPADNQLLQQKIQNLSYIKNNEDNIKSIETQMEYSKMIITDVLSEKYVAVNFVPKSLNLVDSYSQSPSALKQKSNQAEAGLGSDVLQDSTLSYIQFIQTQWYESSHPNSMIDRNEVVRCKENYESLNSIIENFFKVRLARNSEGQATLFDFRIGDAKLSDGQKIILQLCVAIHAQGVKLSNVIIIMDEPENHLHPSIIIETIDRIREVLTDGQIFIATHSIPLLAHFGAKYIHFVENGEVKYGGNIPEQVLESLLGDDEEKQRLLEFISLPEQMAMNRFSYECLFAPTVVSTGKNDPQTKQAKELIESIIKKNGSVRILDYGAGKGRLLSSIIDKNHDMTNIDYVAFDPFDTDKAECLSAIELVYSDAKKRYYNTLRDLENFHDKNGFDVVVLSNVLHEIEPKDWIDLFRDEGKITSQLKGDGYLLLIEDTLLPIGEKANSKGFIVLDTSHLRELFVCNNNELEILSEQNNRLKAHLIPALKLKNITSDSKKKCFKSLISTAKGEIKRIREIKTPNIKDGRQHAFWTQQLANAIFALDEM